MSEDASATQTQTATSTEFSTAQTEDIETMSYERAREELISVVTKLETGGAPLEESLALWQRGEALADRCERWLDGARTRLEEVRVELTEDR
ncbi:exodeoxyribonuclease VII small subunit [Nesterenkonia sandarakina]|uniref:Exodeoxyribonuclease 7 small subunit n=1 Tax=Nesterenkonia sandarakina TaxID=272918 RepID=A0A2T0YD76_9MICC|nr:exodeoxyribonuclease VII small subunit [Nesterenkonia sandarakina]PRZ12768.1 exodeoxyribonuclease VII small subunit [Nesterenkonia sandarakina]